MANIGVIEKEPHHLEAQTPLIRHRSHGGFCAEVLRISLVRMDLSPLKKGPQIVRCDVEIILHLGRIPHTVFTLSNESPVSGLNVTQHVQPNAAYQGEHVVHSDRKEVVAP